MLATTDQLDRIFEITNNGGVIDVERLSGTPGLPEPGLGLGGIGESIPLFPMVAPPAGSLPCRFKAWIGTCYSEGWNPAKQPLGLPWGIQGGLDPNGDCCLRSFSRFRVGDGSGTSNVTCFSFHDLDADGQRDAGEPGLPGLTVCLSSPEEMWCTLTEADGSYLFEGIPAGSFELSLLDLPDDYVATTQLTYAIDACGCEPIAGYDFGALLAASTCEGHTRGFWSNPNGRALILQYDLLSRLPGLNLRTADGSLFTTTQYNVFRSWLQGANAVNMAYMLSAQLVAMDFNRAVGFVEGDCRIVDKTLGVITIDDLIDLAIASLATDGYTPTGHPQRAYQETLKNALDAANNNLNWW